MNLKEFLKNPAKAIFNQKNNLSEQPLESPEVPNEDTVVKRHPDFFSSLMKKDWKWLFRGKTGVFFKIVIPTLILIAIVQPFFTSPRFNQPSKPPVIDPGDELVKPPFEKVGYVSGTFHEDKFLVFNPNADVINKIGIRGIVLEQIPVEVFSTQVYPISDKGLLYISNSNLTLIYPEIEIVSEGYKDVEVETVKEITLFDGISSLDKLKNLHKTYDNNIAFTLEDTFYVFDFKGNEVKRIDATQGELYTYFNEEVYYIRKDASSFSLVKLNRNDEEIYTQNLGSDKPHRFLVINNERYLLLFERPTEDSFFKLEMRDPNRRVVFSFTPVEEVEKLTAVDHISFSTQENVVLLLGNNIAKLFDLRGNQLWIR